MEASFLQYMLSIGSGGLVGFALGLIDPFPVTFSFGWPLRSEAEDQRQVFAFSLTFR